MCSKTSPASKNQLAATAWLANEGRVGKMEEKGYESSQSFLHNGYAKRPDDMLPVKANRRVRPRWLLVVFICVLFVDLLLFGLVYVLSKHRLGVQAACHDPEKFCIPCESLRLSPGENKHSFMDFGYQRVDRALDGDCCAGNPEDLQRLVEIFVKRRQRIRRLKELEHYTAGHNSSSKVKPAAHLVKLNSPTLKITDSKQDRGLLWDHYLDHDLSFIRGCKWSDNKVTVLETGYYYVYSQLIFEQDNTSSANSRSVCHILMRQNPTPGIPEDELLTNTVTMTGDASEAPSSYLGAVFELMQNDTVWIRVDGRGAQINPKKHTHGNYFGLYKV